MLCHTGLHQKLPVRFSSPVQRRMCVQEQVRDGFMEQTSQLQRFSVWLQLKDRPHSPTFQVLFKYVACNML